MKGRRPLTDEEIASVEFTGTSATRDRALFVLGCKTGLRVSELLSLRVRDLTDRVNVRRCNTKGKLEGRSVAYHPAAREAVDAWVYESGLGPDDRLFKSQCGTGAITRVRAWRILKDAFGRAGITGPTGTHSMRKSFAQRVYKALERDLVKTKAALGHKDINSTVSYLSFECSEVDNAILSL